MVVRGLRNILGNYMQTNTNHNINLIISCTIDCGIFRSFITTPTPGQANPGLVEDGTQCGTDRLCIDQECRNVSSLNIPPCPKGSNGLTCSGNTTGVSLILGKILQGE